MEGLASLPMHDQATLVFAALVLFTSFALLAQDRLFNLITVFAWQGAMLAATAALIALSTGQAGLYISAFLTLSLKTLLIPWMLRRLAVRLGVRHEIEVFGSPTLMLMAGAAIVVFSYNISLPVVQLSDLVTRNIIAVSLAVVLLSMLLMISRRQAISQVVGFMALENGLFFAAVSATYGMPMVVELGVAFDVLVAAVLFGVFFLQIRDTIDSLDVDRLSRLSEDVE